MGEIRLLLVDDEEDFVRTVAERLRIRGFQARVALSGQAALDLLDEERPEVMVLDLCMPGMDGLDVLRRVRRDHPHLPVLVLTGHGSRRARDESRRLGAFDCLQKPVVFGDLLSRVQAAVEARPGATPTVAGDPG